MRQSLPRTVSRLPLFPDHVSGAAKHGCPPVIGLSLSCEVRCFTGVCPRQKSPSGRLLFAPTPHWRNQLLTCLSSRGSCDEGRLRCFSTMLSCCRRFVKLIPERQRLHSPGCNSLLLVLRSSSCPQANYRIVGHGDESSDS